MGILAQLKGGDRASAMRDLLGSVGCVLICSSPFVIASGAVAGSIQLKDTLAKQGAMMAFGGGICTALAYSFKREDQDNGDL